MVLSIYPIGNNLTIYFAASELAIYLERITNREVRVQRVDRYDSSIKDGIVLGTYDNVHNIKMPDVEDPYWDDAIAISVLAGQGTIAGSNPRSVLLAVYRFLRALGCRWFMPGRDGEFLPVNVDLSRYNIELTHKASHRHRGWCIEGSLSREHLLDVIDYLPKAGFNTYFTQFRESYEFMQRWYEHRGNPLAVEEPFNKEKAQRIINDAIDEIIKRNLLYHAVGHGWTCEPFGVAGYGWDKINEPPPDSIKPYLAEIDGKRDWFDGVPLNTNLCYSNPFVRETIVQSIVDYCQHHPYVDALHFWLGDGKNNHCECDNCKDIRPSDFYVILLNQCDEALTQRNINTKIVFLIYVDLLWKPLQEKINNKDRFIMMFAPITRNLTEPLRQPGSEIELLPYERNRLKMPTTPEENLAYLKSWQDVFDGDSFDFDYHLMWAHIKDPGYMVISKSLHEDCKNMQSFGLNGFISCQVQRAAFPTGLAITCMGEALWDNQSNYESVCEDYFQLAFGENWKLALEILNQLSEKKSVSMDFEALQNQIQTFKEISMTNLQRQSWLYLSIQVQLWEYLFKALNAKHNGDKALTEKLWTQAHEYACQMEPLTHHVLDLWLFHIVYNNIFSN